MAKMLTIAPKGKPKGRGRGAPKKRSSWRGYVFFALGGVFLALVARMLLVQAYHIPSRSMEDTLLVGDYLLIDKLTYGVSIPFVGWRLPALAQPQPGEVVIFRYPPDPQRVYVKRCIAVAGQRIEIRDKVVYVDGVRTVDPPYSKYVDARIFPATQNPRDNFGPSRVPAGTIFVIGDNRDNSRDSRHWGFLTQEAIVGRAMFLYWSCEPIIAFRQGGMKGFLGRLVTLPRRIRWNRLGHWVR